MESNAPGRARLCCVKAAYLATARARVRALLWWRHSFFDLCRLSAGQYPGRL